MLIRLVVESKNVRDLRLRDLLDLDQMVLVWM